MNGEIYATSEPGYGTTVLFSVTFDRAEIAPAQVDMPDDDEHRLRQQIAALEPPATETVDDFEPSRELQSLYDRRNAINASLLRGSLLAAVIAVTLHDVLLPVAPLLLRWEYDIGYWLLSQPHEFPSRLHLSHHSPSVWLHWSTFFTVGRPLLVGSLVLGSPAAVAAYGLTLWWAGRSRPNAPAPPAA